MERRATQEYKYARKVIDMPDDTISLQISLDARRSARRNHEFILATQPTKSDARPLNTIRRIWNNIPRETCQINSLTNFKKAMKTLNIYENLVRKKIIQRTGESL
jgi:hypothetical protein